MDYLINMPVNNWSVDEFDSTDDLKHFYQQYGCNGIEAILVGDDFSPKMKADMIPGLHLSFYANWLPLWQNDTETLMKAYGSEAAWTEFFQAKNREELIEVYGKQLIAAHKLGVKYVVYHVGDTTLDELYAYDKADISYKNQQIIDGTVEMANTLYDRYGEYMDYDFLFENLTVGELNLLNPKTPLELLDRVKIPNTGIVLDTGHLSNTNLAITNQDDACDYIMQILDRNESLIPYIKVMHLNCSVAAHDGFFAEVAKNVPLDHSKSYLDQFAQVYNRLGKADQHIPFTTSAIQKVVDRVQPEVVVNELAHHNREEWGDRIGTQMAALGKYQK